MWAKNWAGHLRKIVSPPASWSIVIGGASLLAMMTVVVVDVALRTFISRPLKGTIEIVAMLLVPVMIASLARTELQGSHIQVDVLIGRLSSKAQKIITISGYFMSILINIVITWQFFEQAAYLKNSRVVTGLLQIPEWPVIVLIGIFSALFTIALLVTFLEGLGELLSEMGLATYIWLLPGITITLAFLIFSFKPQWLGIELTPHKWGAIVTCILFALIFLKVHIGSAMAVAAFFGVSMLTNPQAGLTNLPISAISIVHEYTWSVMPLFTWMGLLVFFAGFANALYKSAYTWVGHFPGGLASATTAACAGLAAIVGDTLTGVYSMGTIALPQMKEYKYDMKLATATICAASTIGMLIPPSLGFIIYGMITEVSIGKLFIAGIFPGILLTGVLIAMITIRSILNPALGPRGEAASWKQRFVSLKGVWTIVILMVVCLGGIYTGIFTPNEAAGIGAFGALVLAIASKRLNLENFFESIRRALSLSCAINYIFVFAVAFTHFIAMTNLPFALAEWVVDLGLGHYGLIAFILFFYMILGCVMNALPAVILTLPIFFPIAMEAGYDPVWFGVLIVLMVELGVLTPPIGMNVFAMCAVAKDVPMYDVFRGILPFWLAFIVVVIIIVLFPQICLFLPNLM